MLKGCGMQELPRTGNGFTNSGKEVIYGSNQSEIGVLVISFGLIHSRRLTRLFWISVAQTTNMFFSNFSLLRNLSGDLLDLTKECCKNHWWRKLLEEIGMGLIKGSLDPCCRQNSELYKNFKKMQERKHSYFKRERIIFKVSWRMSTNKTSHLMRRFVGWIHRWSRFTRIKRLSGNRRTKRSGFYIEKETKNIPCGGKARRASNGLDQL